MQLSNPVRMGRLLGIVAQNPRNIGVGIDEDTAIVVTGCSDFRVLGSGAVYVADGTGISYSSLSENQPEDVVSIYDVRLHVLRADDAFDPKTRRPRRIGANGRYIVYEKGELQGKESASFSLVLFCAYAPRG
jgi:cyanophycinase-like exopeptidase